MTGRVIAEKIEYFYVKNIIFKNKNRPVRGFLEYIPIMCLRFLVPPEMLWYLIDRNDFLLLKLGNMGSTFHLQKTFGVLYFERMKKFSLF